MTHLGLVKVRDYDARHLFGPVSAIGNCLAPLMPAGTMAWYDTIATPTDGDIVALRFAPVGADESFMAKRLATMNGRRVLTSNSTPPILLNDDFTIIGILACFVVMPDHYADKSAAADAESARMMEGYRAIAKKATTSGVVSGAELRRYA